MQEYKPPILSLYLYFLLIFAWSSEQPDSCWWTDQQMAEDLVQIEAATTIAQFLHENARHTMVKIALAFLSLKYVE